MFVDPRGGQCFVSFCYKATPAIVVEQRTKVNKQRGNNDEKEDEEADTHEEFVAEGEDDIVEDSFDDDEAPESVDDIIEGLFGKSGEEEE